MLMVDRLRSILGDPVADPEEDAFLVFSQAIPSQTLGFIVCKAATVEITVAGKDLTIHQSRGLLASDRKQGTTGAVVWEVTPRFAEWIASPNFLSKAGYLSADTVALELGAGASAIVALTLGPTIKQYIATDQDYVIRLLKQNISENLPAASIKTATNKKTYPKSKRMQTSGTTKASPRIETLELDWELDSISSLPSMLDQDGVDMIIACDCIYNDTLIEPLNSTCAQICRLRSTDQQEKPTLCLIAQQLRSHEVFESWLTSFHRLFHVWQVPDDLLATPLRANSGFVVHVGLLR